MCEHDRAYDLFENEVSAAGDPPNPVHLYCPACGAHRHEGTWYTASDWAHAMWRGFEKV